MNDDVAIKVQDISKTFKDQASSTTLKNSFIELGRKILGRPSGTKKKGYTALKDINFEVKKGEFFGIVGRNGSGKSTLLKIIAGVYNPTKGAVSVNGTLTPFIELGVGFNPELSGRDNVYLNGALLGFTRKQMDEMYDDIVDFAELKDFMDMKLKNYSSGMQVRLAFSVAIRADSDILLIDEVLAVGDAAFQQKCLRYFDRLKEENKTVIFVTHDMSSVEKYCNKVLVVDSSSQLYVGDVDQSISYYNELNTSRQKALQSIKTEVNKDDIKKLYLRISDFNLVNKDKKISLNDNFEFTFKVEFYETFFNPTFGIKIINSLDGIEKSSYHSLFSRNPINISNAKKGSSFVINLHCDNTLLPGNYNVELYVSDQKDYFSYKLLYKNPKIFSFRVIGSKENYWGPINSKHKYTYKALK